ncbi:MAG: hypothetical protein Ctma_0713 [Catillopecten margaritatus gill symbiont]|uniref:DNA polymerase III tau subunit domain-containing protein n=1 Tax=Catillopecten margaritatus gill symbiont TaxID=3083288 RepID=A0AAU6PG74_9GAMM
MVLKNTVFANADNQVLTLNLDAQYSSMLTEASHKNILTTLQENFAITDVKINLDTLTEQTLAQKEIQANNKKTEIRQKEFLADEGVQKLQQVFNTKIDLNSIKEVKNV